MRRRGGLGVFVPPRRACVMPRIRPYVGLPNAPPCNPKDRGSLFMRFSMPRLYAPSGIAHSGKHQNHEYGVSMHGSSQRFLSMPKRHFGRRPRFRKPPCERKLRSERHGTTTVAGPTRKLFFIMEKGFFSVKAGSGKAWPLRQVAEKTTFFPKRENGKVFFVTIMCFSSHG